MYTKIPIYGTHAEFEADTRIWGAGVKLWATDGRGKTGDGINTYTTLPFTTAKESQPLTDAATITHDVSLGLTSTLAINATITGGRTLAISNPFSNFDVLITAYAAQVFTLSGITGASYIFKHDGTFTSDNVAGTFSHPGATEVLVTFSKYGARVVVGLERIV